MNPFNIPDSDIPLLIKQNQEWGQVKIPESLQSGLSAEQERDLKIILEDRRVTDLSAQYWMKLRPNTETNTTIINQYINDAIFSWSELQTKDELQNKLNSLITLIYKWNNKEFRNNVIQLANEKRYH